MRLPDFKISSFIGENKLDAMENREQGDGTRGSAEPSFTMGVVARLRPARLS